MGLHEAGRMLQRIGRAREPLGRQTRRQHAVLRRAAGVERLRHAAEVGDQPRRQRSADRDGILRRVGIEAVQAGAGRGRRDRAQHCRRMEAALVQRAGLQLLQQRPDLVAGHIGAHDVGTARIRASSLPPAGPAPAPCSDGRRAPRRHSPARVRQRHSPAPRPAPTNGGRREFPAPHRCLSRSARFRRRSAAPLRPHPPSITPTQSVMPIRAPSVHSRGTAFGEMAEANSAVCRVKPVMSVSPVRNQYERGSPRTCWAM